jgi:hypothetical protein
MKIKSLGRNVHELHLQNAIILFSYETPVAGWFESTGYWKTTEHYSKTTSKHINMWLKSKEAEKIEELAPSTIKNYFENI